MVVLTGAAVATVAAGVAVVATGGAAAPAIAGAVASVTGGGAVAGAGATAGVTTGFLVTGPIGWLALGCDSEQGNTITWDCWKPILHEDCQVPSDGGILLRDILMDKRIQNVIVEETSSTLPNIILLNIWGESFRLHFVTLPSEEMALHAELILFNE